MPTTDRSPVPPPLPLVVVLGLVSLLVLVLSPSISDRGHDGEWVFDLAYLVAVVVGVAGWVALVVGLVGARRHGGSLLASRLSWRFARAAAALTTGVLAALLVLHLVLDVGRANAWVPLVAELALGVSLVAWTWASGRGSGGDREARRRGRR